jgi:hypothetical protein
LIHLSILSIWICRCKACHRLQEDIKSLKGKIEQASQVSMVFATNSKKERHSFKRPFKKQPLEKQKSTNIIDTKLVVIIVEEMVTPQLTVTLEKVEVPRGVMM